MFGARHLLLIERVKCNGIDVIRLVADLRGNLVGDHGERELARAVGVQILHFSRFV